MSGVRSRLILPLIGSLGFQAIVLGLLGDDVDVPMGRVGVPAFMVWCLPASLAVGLIVESHTESWDWINRGRILALELICGTAMALISLGLFWLLQGRFPASQVVAVWTLLVAVGTCSRPAIGRAAWLVVLVLALVLLYGLATPGSMLLTALAKFDSYMSVLSLLAIVAIRASRLSVQSASVSD